MKILNKTVVFVLAAVIAMLPAAMPANAQKSSEKNESGYENGIPVTFDEEIALAADNGRYRLYYRKAESNFYIEDTEGNRWDSTPQGLDFNAEYANEAASLVKVTYYNKALEEGTFYSYPDSVARSQVTTERINNGLRIIYSMGEDTQKTILPAIITEKSMEDNILSKLGEGRKRRRLLSKYRFLSRDEVTDESEWKELISQYPILKEQNIYVLGDTVQREKEELSDTLSEIGYTVEMRKADEEAAGGTSGTATQPFVKIPLDIRLTDAGFNISVNTEKIETDGDCMPGSIDLLPMFDSRSKAERGEILYPDGCGAVYSFGETIEQVQSAVTKAVYGSDYSRLPNLSYIHEQPVRLPVIGVTGENRGFISVIKSGAAIASLTAAFSVSSYPYNRAYASFAVRNAEQFTFEDWYNAGYRYNIVDKNQYKGEISIDYFLLSGEKASLAGQAAAYREYLTENGSITKSEEKVLPFYLETSGVFEYEKKVNGVSKKQKTPLTDFEQAKIMLKELSPQAGGMRLIYTAWANGGFNYSVYTKIKPEKILGGEKGIKSLQDYAENNNTAFYPQLETVTVVKDKWFDGFSAKKDSVLRLDKKIGTYYEPLLATGREDEKAQKYVLRSDKALKNSAQLLKSVNQLGLDSVALSSVGEFLSSSSQSKYIDRCKAEEDIVNIIKTFSSDKKQLLRGGNAYVLPYSADILNIPTHSSKYSVTGYDVPFLSMVLSGSVSFAGEPLNISGDYETAVLEAALNGTGVYFLLHYANSEYLSQAGYGEYYSTAYSAWKDQAKETYDRLNKVLGNVYGSVMINCTLLDDGVYKTDYDNGKSVLVNFNKTDYRNAEINVPARDFVLY